MGAGSILFRLLSKTTKKLFSFKFETIFHKIMRTYGEKPISFKFEGNDNEYMIGSEVGNYVRLFRGALYKRFPGLTRRTMTNEERKKLVEMGHSQHVSASSITLLLVKEVEELLYGNEEKYKGTSYNFERLNDPPKPKVAKT